jgi:eukaryotic-like serine/threonine-protein kinase
VSAAPDAEAWAALQPLVDRALDLEEPARSAFVEEVSHDDPEAGRRLADFLRTAEAACEPVERALARQPGAVIAALTEIGDEPDLPERIGPYVVRGTIGRGGMGTVLLAERADGEFEQQVAVKLVKKGMDSAEILERFRAERQIVARLQHPHIARLLDGGATASGQPWFAMEHVSGQALVAYCDDRRLPAAARVRLFLQVCDAVEYAHRNLVVHRDLKPSNVMVTADGQAKLLDFGIAKLLDADGEDATLTRREARALTPAYAAPEQLRGEPVTTATDVYSLGVTLYELLSGHRPFAAATRSSVEAAVLQEEPEPPSRAAVRGDAETRGRVAEARGTTADRLPRILRDDLDTIVLQAMRKAPERRYASARALADDLRRHLDGMPVVARPDTLAYRASRFVRRHRVGVAAAALVVVSIVGGVAATVRQTREALRQARRAEEVKTFVQNVFAQSDPNAAKGREVTARQLMDQGTRRVRTELASQPDLQAEMLLFLGNLHLQVGLEKESLPVLEQARDLRRNLYGEGSLGVAEVEIALGYAASSLGQLEAAQKYYGDALLTRGRALGEHHADTALARGRLGRILLERGDLPGAREALSLALVDQRRTLPAPHSDLAASLNAMGRVHQARGDYDQARALYEESLQMRRQLFGNEHTQVSETLVNLAGVFKDQGRAREAVSLFREALEVSRRLLGNRHEKVAIDLNNLGGALVVTADYPEAETCLRESLAIREGIHGAGHPRTAVGLHNLARVLRYEGQLEEAESRSRAAVALGSQMLGNDHPSVAAARAELAQILLARGQLTEAEALARQALAATRAKLPPDHPQVADVLLALARVALAAGRAAEAETLAAEVAQLRAKRLGPGDWRTGEARLVRAECLDALGRGEEARSEAAATATPIAASLGKDHPLAVEARMLSAGPRAATSRQPGA